MVIKPVQIEISIFTFIFLTSANAKVRNMLILRKNQQNLVILVIRYFTVLPCSSFSSSG